MFPSGVVALLLTDVEGSTDGWNASPQEMDGAVAALDDDISSIVAGHAGSIVKARGEGDSHFAVFSETSLSDCGSRGRCSVVATAACRCEPAWCSVSSNHGMTTMWAPSSTMVRAIRSVAHGGQIVATRSVVDVAHDHLETNLGFQTLKSRSHP